MILGSRIAKSYHRPWTVLHRGGPRSSDHVDVLGNIDVMTDFLRIAAGQQLEDDITSNIKDIALRVFWPEDDGGQGGWFS